MVCQHCGFTNQSNAKFCASCGHALVETRATASSDTSSTIIFTQPQNGARSAFMVFGLVAVAFATFVYYAGAIDHKFTKLSCSLSDGSAIDCGAGPTPYIHRISAALFLAAGLTAIVASARIKKGRD